MRPKLGIALGSGAARGWAHIGVLEALNGLGIVPEIVCGTSIGALVGAAFVTGKLAALKARMEAFSRRDVASLLDLRLMTGGLIEGKRIEIFLEGLGIKGKIEDLPVRYGAVSTDLATGREVWLQSGLIGRAVRASIGMPGVFSPMPFEGGWLVDGGLVNPTPVALARALGADIVIAVDLNAGLLGRRFGEADDDAAAPQPRPAIPEFPQWLKDAATPLLARMFEAGPEYPSYFEVLANSLNIMQDRITRARLAGDPPDVLLRPSLQDLSWMDFHRATDAIAAGSASVDMAKIAIQYACRKAGTARHT